MGKEQRSFGEKLIAQLPGFVALGFIGLGVLVWWEAHQEGRTPPRGSIYLFVIGIVALGYWAFANKSNDYNF